MSHDLVAFDDVEVIRVMPMGIVCRVRGQEVWIGSIQIRQGTTIRRRGDLGRLVLQRDDAQLLGLLGG